MKGVDCVGVWAAEKAIPVGTYTARRSGECVCGGGSAMEVKGENRLTKEQCAGKSSSTWEKQQPVLYCELRPSIN